MIGRAAALTNLGDKDRAFRAKKQAFGSFFRFSPCRCALMRRKLRQRQIPSFGRRTVRVCRETDFSGCCFARKYDGMGTSEKSLPLSPVSPAERTRLRGAEAPQRKPRAAPAKAGSEGLTQRGFLRLLLRPEIQLHGDAEKKPPFVKGRFGGNVETRISPAVTSPGNTTAWGRRRNPTARGSCSPRSGGKAP